MNDADAADDESKWVYVWRAVSAAGEWWCGLSACDSVSVCCTLMTRCSVIINHYCTTTTVLLLLVLPALRRCP